MSLTETEGGLDIVLEGVRPSPAALGAFAGKAASLGVARLTLEGESIGSVAAPADRSLRRRSQAASRRLPPGLARG